LTLHHLQTNFDPVPVPGVLGVLAGAEFLDQVTQHPQVVEWVDLAGDVLGQRAHPRAAQRIGGHQRRLGVDLVEVLDDRHRLRERGRAVLQQRHQALRRHGREGRTGLLVAHQMHRPVVIRERLQRQRDAHPK
jgi:hypothetical protein